MTQAVESIQDEGLNEEGETQQDPLGRWITFRLEDEVYGIDVIRVREILRAFNVMPVPGSPPCVLGITNIRGSVVTVIDGRSHFKLPSSENDEDTRLIVIESGDEIAGVIVDSVSDVVDLPISAIDTNPKLNARKGSQFIKGIVNHANGLIIILSVDTFFSCG